MHRRDIIFFHPPFRHQHSQHPTYACWISVLDGTEEQNQQNNQNWIRSVNINIRVGEKYVAVVSLKLTTPTGMYIAR